MNDTGESTKIPEEDADIAPAHEKRFLAAAICRNDVEHEERRDAFDELAQLIQMGVPPTQAVDAYAVDVIGLTPEEWAEFRGTGPNVISINVNKARDAVLEWSDE